MEPKIQYINSITKAFDVLKLFHTNETELGIREISARLAMNATTVYRIVRTLELNGMLVQNPENSKYSPSFAILEMAHAMFRNFDDKQVIRPFMKALQAEFNEDVVLSVLHNTSAVCIDRLESANGINLSSSIGRVLPLTRGATGKVFLPYLDRVSLDSLLDQAAEAAGGEKAQVRHSLEQDLAAIRRDGFISSRSELDDGVFAIAVPLFKGDGEIKYSLGVCGTTERMETKGPDKVAARLVEFGQVISRRLEELGTVQR